MPEAPEKPGAAAKPAPMGKPKKSPLDLADYHYSQKRLHQISFGLSLILFGSCCLMIWRDYDREWKQFQRAFTDVDVALLRLSIDRIEAQLAGPQAEALARARALKREQEERLAADPAYQDVLKRIAEIKPRHELLEMNKKFADSEQKAWRATYEHALDQAKYALDPAAPQSARLGEIDKEREEAARGYEKANEALLKERAEFDVVDVEMAALRARREEMEVALKAAKAEILRFEDEKEKLEIRLQREKPSLASAVRNAPVLDFFAPQFKVKQVILPDVPEDLSFVTTEKVDRCMTCHLGIGDADWAAARDDDDAYHFKDPVRRKIFEPDWKPSSAEDQKALDDPVVKSYLEGARKKWVEEIRTKHAASPDDRQRFTKAFMAHPRLDLYVGPSSPHPVERFGCTSCHRGDGRDTDFSRAVHTPESELEERTWRRRNGYEHRELWDTPMLPQKYVYASCRKCHSQQVDLPGADPYVKGATLFARAGCYGCHRTEGYSILEKDLPKLPGGEPDRSKLVRRPGPPLTHVSEKVSRDWAYHWVLEPRAFRASTRMPHFFGQSNARTLSVNPRDWDAKAAGEPRTVEPASAEGVIVGTMLEYLWGLSTTRDLPAPPDAEGDAKKGEYVFKSAGCVACHTVATNKEHHEAREKDSNRSFYLEEFGPSLSGIGGKVDRAWLRRWLRNPHDYFPGTRMPNLRLTDAEAAHLVEYLMGLKEPDWEARVAAGRPPNLLDDGAQDVVRHLMFEFVSKRTPAEAARREILAMDPKSRVLWLGEKMVQTYGCYGCHEIHDPAKDAKRQWTALEGIGVELTGAQPIASKFLDQFDFGVTLDDGVNYHGIEFEHPVEKGADGKRRKIVAKIRHSKQDWLHAKMLNPRVYDAGRLESKPPDELLRMPDFRLTEAEADLLTTFLLSLTSDEVKGLVNRIKKPMTDRDRALARGERLVRDMNCASCHRFEAAQFRVTRDVFDPEKGKAAPMTGWVDIIDKGPIDAALVNNTLPPEAKRYSSYSNVAWIAQHETLALPPGFDASRPYLPDEWVSARRPMDGGDILTRIFELKSKYVETETDVQQLYPPWLRTQGHKTEPKWLFDFLKNPHEIRPALSRNTLEEGPYADEIDVNVRMGDFALTDEEAASLVNYFIAVAGTDALESSPHKAADVPTRRKEAMDEARKLLLTNCVACHVLDGNEPTDKTNRFKWAPELRNVQHRLRPRWLRAWLVAPSHIAPGVVMSSMAEVYSADKMPGFKSNADAVDALVELLYHLDAVHPRPGPKQPSTLAPIVVQDPWSDDFARTMDEALAAGKLVIVSFDDGGDDAKKFIEKYEDRSLQELVPFFKRVKVPFDKSSKVCRTHGVDEPLVVTFDPLAPVEEQRLSAMTHNVSVEQIAEDLRKAKPSLGPKWPASLKAAMETGKKARRLVLFFWFPEEKDDAQKKIVEVRDKLATEERFDAGRRVLLMEAQGDPSKAAGVDKDEAVLVGKFRPAKTPTLTIIDPIDGKVVGSIEGVLDEKKFFPGLQKLILEFDKAHK